MTQSNMLRDYPEPSVIDQSAAFLHQLTDKWDVWLRMVDCSEARNGCNTMCFLIYLFNRVTVFYRSESDVCRRQIMTYKDGPRHEIIKIVIMAVDPQHRYSNERAN